MGFEDAEPKWHVLSPALPGLRSSQVSYVPVLFHVHGIRGQHRGKIALQAGRIDRFLFRFCSGLALHGMAISWPFGVNAHQVYLGTRLLQEARSALGNFCAGQPDPDYRVPRD